jgi:hypothetical protein
MFITIISATYVDNHQIQFQFSDGKTGVVDLLPFLQGAVFEPLRNKEAFQQFSIDPNLETIVWENGANLAPEFLYFQSFKNDSSLRSQFIQWGYLPKVETA